METIASVPYFWGLIPCFQMFEGLKLELSKVLYYEATTGLRYLVFLWSYCTPDVEQYYSIPSFKHQSISPFLRHRRWFPKLNPWKIERPFIRFW